MRHQRAFSAAILLSLAFLLSPATAPAQLAEPVAASHDDPQFAASGDFIVSMSTGLPYVGAAEAAYGFSNRATVGILGGYIPRTVDGMTSPANGLLPGYGLRLRTVLYDNDNFRMYSRLPLIYYPETSKSDREPWFLAWPTLAAEWHGAGSLRYWVVGGVAAKACQESIFGHEEEETEPMMGGYAETLGAGASFNAAERLTLAAEASVVTQRFNIADEQKVGGTPIIFVLQASYAFGK